MEEEISIPRGCLGAGSGKGAVWILALVKIAGRGKKMVSQDG